MLDARAAELLVGFTQEERVRPRPVHDPAALALAGSSKHALRRRIASNELAHERAGARVFVTLLDIARMRAAEYKEKAPTGIGARRGHEHVETTPEKLDAQV